MYATTFLLIKQSILKCECDLFFYRGRLFLTFVRIIYFYIFKTIDFEVACFFLPLFSRNRLTDLGLRGANAVLFSSSVRVVVTRGTLSVAK